MNRIEKSLCALGKTRIPSRLSITENDTDGCIDLILDGKKIQKKGMLRSGNDFEGWAIAIHICAEELGIDKKIHMDLDENKRFKYEKYEGKGHLGRFLYRAMKFSQQYGDWFELSDYLKNEVSKFETYLKRGTFINSIDNDAAGSKNRHNDENVIEEAMAANPDFLRRVVKSIDIGTNPVYRQLPVGLFIDDVAKRNRVFTDGKSAIDLWTQHGDEINIVELKTKNIMMGIVTEIFFYSNFILDLVSEDGLFTMTEPPKKSRARDINLKGYEELYNERPKKVNGIMLADNMRFHPWIKNGILDVLNHNQTEELNYFMDSYCYDVFIG